MKRSLGSGSKPHSAYLKCTFGEKDFSRSFEMTDGDDCRADDISKVTALCIRLIERFERLELFEQTIIVASNFLLRRRAVSNRTRKLATRSKWK